MKCFLQFCTRWTSSWLLLKDWKTVSHVKIGNVLLDVRCWTLSSHERAFPGGYGDDNLTEWNPFQFCIRWKGSWLVLKGPRTGLWSKDWLHRWKFKKLDVVLDMWTSWAASWASQRWQINFRASYSDLAWQLAARPASSLAASRRQPDQENLGRWVG